jgi:hypothetical protein
LFSQIGPVKGCKIIREVRRVHIYVLVYSDRLKVKLSLCSSIIYEWYVRISAM